MSSQAIGGFASKKWVAAANGPDAFGLACRLNKLLECIASQQARVQELKLVRRRPAEGPPAHRCVALRRIFSAKIAYLCIFWGIF